MSHVQTQKVSWFELFYDLIVVAAIAQSSHIFATEPTWGNTVWIGVALFTLFSVWLLTTFSHESDSDQDPVRWVLVLVQMLAIIVGALAMGREGGLPDRAGFGAVAIAFLTISLMYVRGARRSANHRTIYPLVVRSTAGGALILLIGAIFPLASPRLIVNLEPWCFGLGLLVATLPFYSAGLVRALRSGLVRYEHLGERFGLLIIIVLGESFTSLVVKLGTARTIPNPLFFVLTMLVVFSVWLLYFHIVAPAGVPSTVWRLRLWLASHWGLLWAATSTATAFSTLATIRFSGDQTQEAHYWTALPLLSTMVVLLVLNLIAPTRPPGVTAIHIVAIAVLAALSVVGLLVLHSDVFVTMACGAAVVSIDALVVTTLTRRHRSTGAVGHSTA